MQTESKSTILRLQAENNELRNHSSARQLVLYRKKINQLRVRNYRLKKKLTMPKPLSVPVVTPDCIVKQASNFLGGKVLSFFAAQLNMSRRKINGYRWTNVDKRFALDLYSISHRMYAYLSSDFSLPSKSTLMKWVRQESLATEEQRFLEAQLVAATKHLEPVSPIELPIGSAEDHHVSAYEQQIILVTEEHMDSDAG